MGGATLRTTQRTLSKREGFLEGMKAALLSALCFFSLLYPPRLASHNVHSCPGLPGKRSVLSEELENDRLMGCAGGSVGCEACPLCSDVATILWFQHRGIVAFPG
jgi:hypothetical protein